MNDVPALKMGGGGEEEGEGHGILRETNCRNDCHAYSFVPFLSFAITRKVELQKKLGIEIGMLNSNRRTHIHLYF